MSNALWFDAYVMYVGVLQRLEEALRVPPHDNEFRCDATLLRHAQAVRAMIELLRQVFALRGVVLVFPQRICLYAQQLGWFASDEEHSDLLRVMFAIDSIYTEDEALELYNEIRDLFPVLERIKDKVQLECAKELSNVH